MPAVVRLFGTPALHDGRRWVEFGTTLDDALLCYLAMHPGWVARAVLAGRLWPDSNEAAARANLRWRLHRVRSRRGTEGLEATRHDVRWTVETDLQRFWQAYHDGDTDTMVSLARAPLLGDARFDTCPTIEAVFTRERELVHRAWRDAALAYARAASEAHRHADAAAVLARVLDADVLDEEALKAYLHAASREGQREQALRSFARFEQHLRDEFGLAPLAETQALVATIRQADRLGNTFQQSLSPGTPASARQRRFDPPDAGSMHAPVAPVDNDAPAVLPSFLTPFVGRTDEHERLTRLLRQDGERLVTLLGLGGAGKTRLAVEVARSSAKRFRNGVAFVDAAGVEDPARLACAISEAVAPRVQVGHDPVAQLIELLRERELLLVIDGFEAVAAAAPVIARLLASSPRVQVLVTSRVRLGLSGERAFEVHGLPCPEDGATPDATDPTPAEVLFEAVAARMLGAFEPSLRERASIARICRHVGGLPLAIELAATWVRVLNCDAIADELAASTTLLALADGNGAGDGRHATFEQVFEASWALLEPDDRSVFAALAVFRGGFTRDTAADVAGAELRHLRTLIDASLVQRFDDRYVLLDLIRHLAERELERSGEAPAVRARHAECFTDLLEQQERDLAGPDQADALERLDRERGNLRAAWRFAAARCDVPLLMRMSSGMAALWDLRGHFEEAAHSFALAAQALDAAEPSDEASLAWAWMCTREGWFRTYLGQFDAVEPALHEAAARLERHGAAPGIATVAYVLGAAANARGDFEAGRSHLQRALAAFERLGDHAGVASCDIALGTLEELQGSFEPARARYLRSLRARERLGDSRGLIVVRAHLGSIALALGSSAEADAHLQHALILSRSSGDAWGLAWTAYHLGELALALGHRKRARHWYEQALKGMAHLGHRHASTLPRERLGELSLSIAPSEAAKHFRDALQTALGIAAMPRVAQLTAWLAWLRGHDDPESAVAQLVCVQRAVGSLHRPRQLVERLLRTLRTSLDATTTARAERRGAALDLRAEAEALCRWAEFAVLPRTLRDRQAPP